MSGTDECVKQSMKMRERRRKIKDYNATLHVEQHIKKFQQIFHVIFFVGAFFLSNGFSLFRLIASLDIWEIFGGSTKKALQKR